MRPWIKENQELQVRISELEHQVDSLTRENQSLKQQCSQLCHDDLVEMMRVKYDIPKWLFSKTSYEILAKKDLKGIERFMQERARMFSARPKIVKEEQI